MSDTRPRDIPEARVANLEESPCENGCFDLVQQIDQHADVGAGGCGILEGRYRKRQLHERGIRVSLLDLVQCPVVAAP